jgi:hypothetical protein
LDEAYGPLGAQGLLGRALVGVDLIDGELELPTGVVGDDDLPSGGEIRVQSSEVIRRCSIPDGRGARDPPGCSGSFAP